MLASALHHFGRCFGKPPGWERVVRKLCPPEQSARIGARVQRFEDDVLFRVDPGTLLGWYVYFFGAYEPEVRRLIRRLLNTGCVAIDVGANVGWHTLLMAAQVGENGQVLAFEANPSVRQTLDKGIKLNGFKQVSVHECALSDKSGLVRFDAPAASHLRAGTGRIIGQGEEAGTDDMIEIACKRLDDVPQIMELPRVDLMKVDVEGWEWNALQGATEMVKRFHPYVLFEYDSDYVTRGGGSRDKLAEFFSSHQYSLCMADDKNLQLLAGDWPGCFNVLAVPEKS